MLYQKGIISIFKETYENPLIETWGSVQTLLVLASSRTVRERE